MSKHELDAETRALISNPVFHELIAEGRADIAAGRTVTLEELDRRDPPSPEEREFAEAYSRALDLLEAAQGREVDDGQARTMLAVLSALEHVRGRGTVEQLAKDAGVSARSIRVVAAALKGAGIGAEPRPLAEVAAKAS